MNGSRRKRLRLVGLAVLTLGIGGVAGWWLAMRSMPMTGMTSGAGGGLEGDMNAGERVRNAGIQDMAGMLGMPGIAGQTESGPRAGPGTVQVDPVRLQRIGVRYAVAQREPLGRRIRAEAAVEYNEERKAYVTTKIAGWVERLYVDRPGQPVRRGQPLLDIYSPELISTQRELVLALEHAAAGAAGAASEFGERERTDHSGAPGFSRRDLIQSARRRLELWDVPTAEIERLTRTRQVRRTLTLSAPAGGVVVEKDVLQGEQVDAGENLYLIADLSTVWVEARVFETDLEDIRVGQPATITVKAYANETFPGTVSFVYPYVDPSTRTVRVRLEVPNPDTRLKPGMFATVSFDVSAGREAVVVPASAVIQTGERSFVLVKRGEGVFEPRDVEVGERAGDRIAVAKNLAAGETVVASANFLIDAEANLMAYMGGMLGMGMRADQMRMDMESMQGREGMEDMKREGMEDMKGMKDMEGMEDVERAPARDDMEGMPGMSGTQSRDDRGDMKNGPKSEEAGERRTKE